jgi:hypothetical protein
MEMIWMTSPQETVPELFFLKYKGVPSPWEITSQAKHLGFKCKKYANWSEVHATSSSRQLLKTVGDSLIDSEDFDISCYPELSKVWEKVQRWTKDKDGFSLEPDFLPEYEKLSRLVKVASESPNVVDLILEEFGFFLEQIEIKDRWPIFLSVCIFHFFESKKRYENFFIPQDFEKTKEDSFLFMASIAGVISKLYLAIGFDTSNIIGEDLVYLFIQELGLQPQPDKITREGGEGRAVLPKVWVGKYEGPQTELVNFKYADGDIFIKVNKLNKIFKTNNNLSKLLADDDYWKLIGRTLESHIGQIDDIQDFYNTFARNLRGLK